jgi:hypothetical protein
MITLVQQPINEALVVTLAGAPFYSGPLAYLKVAIGSPKQRKRAEGSESSRGFMFID